MPMLQTNAEESQIKKLRENIDILDKKIASLIIERLELGCKIGQLKKNSGKKEALCKDREKEVLSKVSALGSNEDQKEILRHIYTSIIIETRMMQNRMLNK